VSEWVTVVLVITCSLLAYSAGRAHGRASERRRHGHTATLDGVHARPRLRVVR
jgi:hypothetical protein